MGDIDTSRKACPSEHSTANKLMRVLWGITWLLLFRPSPTSLGGWRRFLLRCFGARVGRGAKIMPSTRIWAPWNLELGDEACLSHHVDCYCVARISVGAHATVSQYAHLCSATHDITHPNMKLIHAPITIGPQAWVCAGAFLGPGVAIGEGAVVGARAVAMRDVEAWEVVAGNPAKFIKTRSLNGA